MSSKIKVDTIENVAGSGNVSLGSGHNLVVPGNITGQGTLGVTGVSTLADNLILTNGAIGIGTSTISTAVGGGIEVHRANGSSFRIEDTTNTVVGELQVYSSGVNLVAQTNHPIIISPNNSEIARFTTAGLHLGGTGAANALDDYEEGTWTATLEGSTSNPSSSVTTTGMYTKIGRQVTLNFKFTNVNTTGASGGIRVSGMPFPPSDTDPSSIGSNISVANGIMLYSKWTGAGHLTNYMTTGYIAVYRSTSNSAWAEAAHQPGAGFYYWSTIVYMTNT